MRLSKSETDTRLPICLLTGFLGAGKSTLLNFVLRHPEMHGTAVVINEFGSVGVDHHLVESAPDDTELVADGCLCCTASGKLAEALMSLFQRAQRRRFKLRRVIIETTGLAEPAPILQQLLSNPRLNERFVIDSVVTLVDAANAPSTLNAHAIAVQQITGADRLIVTKSDLVDAAAIRQLEQQLAKMNPDAVIERLLHGAAQPAQLFSGAHQRVTLGVDFGSMFANADRIRFNPTPAPSSLIQPEHSRFPSDLEIQTFSLILDDPIPALTFFVWSDFLRGICGPTLLRMKGLVHLQGYDVPTVIHGVQNVFHPVRQLDAWPSTDRRTRLVFITRGWGQEAVKRTLSCLQSQLAASTSAEPVS